MAVELYIICLDKYFKSTNWLKQVLEFFQQSEEKIIGLTNWSGQTNRLKDYSDLKLFTGFAIPALMAWKLTVTKVTVPAIPLATKKNHQCRVVFTS